MGFAEQVSVDEGDGQEPSSHYTTRRPTAQGRAGSGSGAALGLRATTASSDGPAGSNLDAILEAARAGAGGSFDEASPDFAASGEEEEGAPAPGSAGAQAADDQAAADAAEPMLRLNVDEVDRENPLRPRYTGEQVLWPKGPRAAASAVFASLLLAAAHR